MKSVSVTGGAPVSLGPAPEGAFGANWADDGFVDFNLATAGASLGNRSRRLFGTAGAKRGPGLLQLGSADLRRRDPRELVRQRPVSVAAPRLPWRRAVQQATHFDRRVVLAASRGAGEIPFECAIVAESRPAGAEAELCQVPG